MTKNSLNRNLHAARDAKKDEFYTQLADIEKELKHYKDHFNGKVVLCNCDDPRVSNFFVYFSQNFEQLGLKKLITTCYKNQNRDLFSQHDSEHAIYLEYTGDRNANRVPDPEEIGIKPLKGDGDFRSDECVELLKQADIVVTNPPFSLFGEYATHMADSGKKFIVIGNHHAVTYKDVFKLIKENRMWLVYSHPEKFIVPDDYEAREYRSWRDENGTNWRSLGNACWFTNLDIAKRHEDLILFKTHNPEDFPPYDNYDAIEVSRVAEIPTDFEGVMGVPVTFLEKYNPEQFEILGCNRGVDQDPNGVYGRGSHLNGKETFKRLFIRNKKPTK